MLSARSRSPRPTARASRSRGRPRVRRDVAGYGVYLNGAQVGTQTPDQVKRWRDRDALSYTLRQLACGTGYTVGVDAFDRGDQPLAGHLDDGVHLGVSGYDGPLGPERDAAGGGDGELGDARLVSLDRQRRCGRVRALRLRSACRDLERRERDADDLACGTSYLVAIDAADAAGNRSTQATSYLRTSACPSSNQATVDPDRVEGHGGDARPACRSPGLPRRTMSRSTGYGLYLAGKRTSETTKTSADFTGLQCGTTYALGVDAFDAAGKRSTVAELSTATSPCAPTPPPTATGTVTQTIANGATLAGVVTGAPSTTATATAPKTTPARSSSCVDGTPGAHREQIPPFGDTAGFWASTTVNDGQHTFQVRALNDTGTVLATNTVTATVDNPTHRHRHRHRRPGRSVTQTIANGATLAGGCELARRLRQQRRRRRRRPRQDRVPRRRHARCSPRIRSRPSVTAPASGRPPASPTASTPSRCARSTTQAPCSPATPSPPPSTTTHHRHRHRHRRPGRGRSDRRSPTERPSPGL